MEGRRVEDRSATELEELVARLERSGLAERRADVRHLLESSRLLLRGRPPGARLETEVPREGPSARKLLGKLAASFRGGLELLLGAGFLWGLGAALMRDGDRPAFAALPLILLALVGPVGILLWRPAWREGGREAGWWLLHHAAWGYDWFAEAFSHRAMQRFSARLTARRVMQAWRRHRASLPHRPGLHDVEAFLAVAGGPRAAEAFWRAAQALEAAGSDRTGQRLAALRWSVLIRLFAQAAAGGAFGPEAAPGAISPGRSPEALPPAPAGAAPEPAGAVQDRQTLAELIRRKRQDIATAHGWSLKSEAEIAQRDAYLRQLREEIAGLEQALAAAGR